MNLRDLSYLVAVADLKHFGKAAAACHVGQPTLSMQLAKLEGYLGVKLFERTSRAVYVTPVGERIVAAARQAVDSAQQVVQIARDSKDPMSGLLRLGVLPTLAPYLMPWLLVPVRRRFPKLQISLTEEPTDHLIGRLLRHELDAALLATSIAQEPALRQMPLFEEPFWVAVPRGHALGEAASITRKDLAEARLLMLSDEHCLRNQSLEVCRHRSKTAEAALPDLRASSLDTLLELVAAGIGCTLIPALATRGPWSRSEKMDLRPLQVTGASRKVALVYRETFPRIEALEALAAVIRAGVPRDLVRVAAGSDSRGAAPKAA